MTIGVPLLPSAPSQSPSTLTYTTVFFKNDDLALLQVDVNSALNVVELSNPQGGTPFLVDVQYQTAANNPDGHIYSVMVLIGQWNPTP